MQSRIANQFSLSTILLVMTIVGLAIALWLERTRKPEVLYLQLYSNRYDIHSMSNVPGPPREMECIATISVISGVPFYAEIPCHYEPRMTLSGTITRQGDLVATNFTIQLQDPGLGCHHKQNQTVPLNSSHEFYYDEFEFSISNDLAVPLDAQ